MFLCECVYDWRPDTIYTSKFTLTRMLRWPCPISKELHSFLYLNDDPFVCRFVRKMSDFSRTILSAAICCYATTRLYGSCMLSLSAWEKYCWINCTTFIMLCHIADADRTDGDDVNVTAVADTSATRIPVTSSTTVAVFSRSILLPLVASSSVVSSS